ncbi:MAG: hypothetical protein ACYC8T_34160 [Myxococcaceae bacterium]
MCELVLVPEDTDVALLVTAELPCVYGRYIDRLMAPEALVALENCADPNPLRNRALPVIVRSAEVEVFDLPLRVRRTIMGLDRAGEDAAWAAWLSAEPLRSWGDVTRDEIIGFRDCMGRAALMSAIHVDARVIVRRWFGS